MVTEFVELVGLICHFRQEKGERQALDHRKFIEWLEYHRHEEIKNLIVNTAALRPEVDSLLRSDHVEMLRKLGQIDATLVKLVERLDHSKSPAEAAAPRSQLSEQGVFAVESRSYSELWKGLAEVRSHLEGLPPITNVFLLTGENSVITARREAFAKQYNIALGVIDQRRPFCSPDVWSQITRAIKAVWEWHLKSSMTSSDWESKAAFDDASAEKQQVVAHIDAVSQAIQERLHNLAGAASSGKTADESNTHVTMSHVFISYVRENEQVVERLCAEMRQQGIEVWRDREQIQPGQRWQHAIRQAIQHGAFFLACFSVESSARDSTYMNEELTLAIDELRKRPTDRAWFIPVLLSDCQVPDRDIGGGETLRSLQWVSMWQEWQDGIRRIISVVKPNASEQPAQDLVESLPKQRAKALSLKVDLSEQAIFILRQFVDSGDTEFFYSDWGNGQWSMQLCHGEQSQISVLEPRFIQDDLDQLVSLRLLTVEYNSQGTPIFHITRNAVRFINTLGGTNSKAPPA